MAIFALARFAFIAYNHSLSPSTPVSELIASAWYGMRMDMATASYILVPFCLLLGLSFLFPFLRNSRPFRIYTQIILLLVILITLSDLSAYEAWGFRLDKSPLKYLNNPKEAWASINHLPLTLIFSVMIISYWIINKIFGVFLRRSNLLLLSSEVPIWQEAILLILFTAGQIIPIRGGLQLAPLNQSSVYFSSDHFANICAINATWNFMNSITDEGNLDSNPFKFLSETEAEIHWSALMQTKADSVARRFSSIPHPNILLITWESLTSKALNRKFEEVSVLPCLERRLKEGIFFDNAFASGDRTDKGIVAILSGYPAQPITSIVKMPEKTRTLPHLPFLLKKEGYQTSFYYGGETEFANMKSYLLGAGFDKITDVKNFEAKERNSKWGAHDHLVMNKIKKDIQSTGRPFFIHWLTLSSHEPFETGAEASITGRDDLSLFMNSLHYTDSVVEHLISYCSRQPWWKETIILISGDHGHRLPQTRSKADDFRTPILLLGGALNHSPERISRVVSQTGIASAICSMTGTNGAFPFSHNILLEPEIPYAYFCFNNGFGYAQNEGVIIFDNVGRSVIEKNKDADSIMLRRGMAIQQKSFEDYLRR